MYAPLVPTVDIWKLSSDVTLPLLIIRMGGVILFFVMFVAQKVHQTIKIKHIEKFFCFMLFFDEGGTVFLRFSHTCSYKIRLLKLHFIYEVEALVFLCSF